MISARPTARDSLLFVYGTLLAFVATAAGDRLRRHSSLVARAQVAGRLYDLGGYPGLAPSRRPGEWVIGELYRLTSPRLTLRALDLYEAGAGPVRARSRASARSPIRVSGSPPRLGLPLRRPCACRAPDCRRRLRATHRPHARLGAGEVLRSRHGNRGSRRRTD